MAKKGAAQQRDPEPSRGPRERAVEPIQIERRAAQWADRHQRARYHAIVGVQHSDQRQAGNEIQRDERTQSDPKRRE
jgi:hypothetical protein